MLAFTRCERGILIALPVAFVSSALLLLVFSTAWSIYGSPAATCFTPQDFSSAWSAYAQQLCSTRVGNFYPAPSKDSNRYNTTRSATLSVLAPGEWADKVPLRLLLLAVVLVLPFMLGDVLGHAAEAVAPSKRPLTRVGTAARSIVMLLTRMVLLVCLLISLSKATMDAPKIDADNNDNEDSFLGITLPTTRVTNVWCDLEFKRLGKNHVTAILCIIRDGPHVVLAKILLLFLWYTLAIVVAWVAMGTAELVVLVACPATRANALKDATQSAAVVDAEEKHESKL